MRLTFLDEAGNSPHEEWLVVAAAIIDGDRQLAAVENHFSIITQKHRLPDGLVFHATDLWSGGAYFKDRDQWPLEKRLAVLDDLIAIPAKFDIPIAFGTVDWAKFPQSLLKPGTNEHDLQVAAHTVAFGHCCMTVEQYMREMARGEVTILIAEDRSEVRKALKDAIAVFRHRIAVTQLGLDPQFFPFVKIRDTVHFAKKSESRHLQVADVSTFFIRGCFMKKKHNDRFWNVLRTQLIRSHYSFVGFSPEQF